MKTLKDISILTTAFSDSNRVRIWMLLQSQEVCVCHIVSILKLANSTISEHLSHLKKADLVTARKQGKWVYYKANATTLFITDFTTLLQGILVQDKQIQADQKTLQKVLGENAC